MKYKRCVLPYRKVLNCGASSTKWNCRALRFSVNAFLFLVFLLTTVSCTKRDKDAIYEEKLGEMDKVINDTYALGDREYVKNKIPFIKTDLSKGEYFKILQYGGEVRAIVCDDNGDTLGNADHETFEKITEVRLYVLNSDEWVPSGTWSINHWGITEFCNDWNGNLYAYYYDSVGDATIGGSKLFFLNQNGSVEETTLEDKDIMSVGVMEEIENNKNLKEGEFKTLGKGRASAYKIEMTENNEVALTYLLASEPDQPKLILYDPYTGEKILETDYLGSDLDQYKIHRDEILYYTVPLDNKAPTLKTSELRTGKLIRTASFGDEGWNQLNARKLRICLGMDEDVYLCTPEGIYGGGLNQEELDLVMTSEELGYRESDYVYFFGVGLKGDFYLVVGADSQNGQIESNDGVMLYHFVPK